MACIPLVEPFLVMVHLILGIVLSHSDNWLTLEDTWLPAHV